MGPLNESLIAAAAIDAGCTCRYGGNFEHEQRIYRMTTLNPSEPTSGRDDTNYRRTIRNPWQVRVIEVLGREKHIRPDLNNAHPRSRRMGQSSARIQRHHRRDDHAWVMGWRSKKQHVAGWGMVFLLGGGPKSRYRAVGVLCWTTVGASPGSGELMAGPGSPEKMQLRTRGFPNTAA